MNKKLLFIVLCFAAFISHAQDTTKYLSSEPSENKTMKHDQTEIYSPVPPVVTPGKSCGDAPSDAIIFI